MKGPETQHGETTSVLFHSTQQGAAAVVDTGRWNVHPADEQIGKKRDSFKSRLVHTVLVDLFWKMTVNRIQRAAIQSDLSLTIYSTNIRDTKREGTLPPCNKPVD